MGPGRTIDWASWQSGEELDCYSLLARFAGDLRCKTSGCLTHVDHRLWHMHQLASLALQGGHANKETS